jgi:conjugative relaxase-like TrwC/TraI family protein
LDGGSLPVLSSAKIGTSSWRYYQNQVARGACEYYLDAGEAPGRWHGRGLSELGLTAGSEVAERQLEAVFGRALHPSTGRPLGRAWRVDGVTGFDLTLSAPKSVSALWALGNDGIKQRIQAAHTAAVNATLSYLDAHAAFSRRGRDGAEQVASAGFAAAVFDHRTSRAGDPQLHSHALVVNKLHCSDGVWRTVDGHEIYHHKKSAGVLYQAALRGELRSRLGVEFAAVDNNGQAEIAGIPQALIETWSKRTTEIEREAGPKIAEFEQQLGRTLTSAERISVTKTAVLKTRTAKEHAPDAVLHARWRDEAARLGWTGDRLRQAVAAASRIRAQQPPAAGSTGALIVEAVTAAGRARATFSRADLAGEIALRLPPAPISAEQLRATVEHLTDTALARGGAIPLGAPQHGQTARRSDPRYATQELLAAEARVLHRAQHGQQTGCGVANTELATQHITRAGLDAGQAAAVTAATSNGDAITVITAPAGAGKTTTLGVAARTWTDSGYTVLGLAPSARAAAELGRATGSAADTVAKWLHDQHHPTTHRSTATRTGRRLDARTVIIVDEASMCSTHDLDRIIAAAQLVHAKVVLVGDPGQIGVIEGPGGLFAALANWTGSIELSGVHRFTQPWERNASLALRQGDPRVLDRYFANGRVHPAASEDAALDAVFTAWAAATAHGQDALMMARNRTDVDRLNSRARDAARQHGTIHGPVIQIGNIAWQADDLLRTRRNNRRLPLGDSYVRNGDRFRVLGAGVDGGLLVEDLTGRGRTTLPASYVAQHAQYGWASTIDAAQGATADIGLLLVRAGLDREHLYVGMTRGRQANHAYIAPGPADHDSHPLSPPPQPFTQEAARQLVAESLTRVGAQQAAHTMIDQTRKTVEETPIVARANQRSDREHDRDRYKQLLREYADRSRDRERLQLEIMRLNGRIRTTEQQLHDLPRWRRRALRWEWTAQLATDRQQLDTTRQRLKHLDQEIQTLKENLDGLLSQPTESESRRGRTRKLMNQGLRPLATQLSTNRSGAQEPQAPSRRCPQPEPGYGIER